MAFLKIEKQSRNGLGSLSSYVIATFHHSLLGEEGRGERVLPVVLQE
jgi:hypothetical protein